jgi:hypothetical protein
VWHKAALKADTSRLELIWATCVLAVDQAHELGSAIAVVVWRAVGYRLVSMLFKLEVQRSDLLWEATSHRGLKIKKSASGAAGSREGAVMTQKMEGSMWSTEIEPTLTNFVRSYL